MATITGSNASDLLIGTVANDTINSGNGDDTVNGGAGSDSLNGGAGEDTLDGDSGNDQLNGGSGRDTLIYNVSENSAPGTKDVYTGGSDIDTLVIEFTRAQWLESATQTQIAAYLAHLAAVTNANNGEVSNGSARDFVFTFGSSTLTVQMTETLRVFVDGVALDPVNQSVTALGDAGTVGEDGAAGVPIYVLQNDSVPDLVKQLALESPPGHGTATLMQPDINNPASWFFQYQPDPAAFQYLAAGQTATDTFTYRVIDADGGSGVATVSVTITGTNDAAVITGTSSGAVVEAGGVANATPGTPTATGDLQASDVDNGTDAFQAVAAGAATTNSYGTYGVTAAGVWTYTLDNTNAVVQALNTGSPALSDSFTVLSEDGTPQVVTITITGSNDAAVITGTSTGAVVEAGGVANGNPGTPSATGDLQASDVDNASDAFQAVAAGAATTNSYGTYGVTAAGVWTYTLDNSDAAVQALNTGSPALSDSFTVLSEDGTPQVVTITISGSNDAAVITGTSSGAVVEAGGVANATPGTPTATGDLLASDVDNAADAFQPVAAGAATSNSYGTYGVTAAGVWTYTLDNSNAAVQALNTGSTALSDSFTVLSEDGTPQVVTVTITGTNDAAVITGTSSGAVVEAGGTPGTPSATGDLLASDVDNASDTFQAMAAGAATTNSYGTYGVTAAGVWTYTLDNTNVAVQALNTGSPALSDSFTVLSEDGTSQVVTVTISGTNDAAVITGSSSGAVVEAGGVANAIPGTPTATGDLLASDVDNGADAFQPVAAGAATSNSYGTYGVTAAGVWTYTLDNSNATVQALNTTSAALSDSFIVLSEDGTSQLVTITITGSNDAAVITGTSTGAVVEAGGVANGTPGTPSATGDLQANDVDNATDAFQAVAAGAATTNSYGTYGVTAAGVWTYTLDNANVAVQTLNTGSPALSDSFTVLSEDGTAQVVTVTISGSNDAAVITGSSTGAVVEAGGVANGAPGTPTATGDLQASDVDNASDAFQPVAAGASTTNSYGSYGVTAAGVWTYTLDNTNAAVQALNTGSPALSDSFTVLSEDGTAQVVTVTISGSNDAAVITGTSSGAVVEAGSTPGTPSASGDLLATDVDNASDAFQAVAAGAATSNSYGTYGVTADGVWTYTLDNSNAAVQALNTGSPALSDSFTVLSEDGTAQLVTVSITGSNDAAVITGTSTGAMVEAGGVANATPGTPSATGDLLASDVDNASDAFQAVAAGAATSNGYGSYGVTAAGVWTYTLDNSNATVQALNTGSPALSDSFTVLSEDGTPQVVTVTISGTNDAAVITGTSTGTVVEAGGVANGNPGTPSATGDLLGSDVDNTTDAFQAVAAGAGTTNSYGTYGVTAAGVWTYTLDNTNAAAQALNTTSAPLSDSFTVLSEDGTSQLVTITITGSNDAAVITGTSSGAVVEAGGVANATPGTPSATGDLLASDVDNGADAFQPVAAGASTTNSYGSYGVTAAGVWTYTLDNTNAAVQALNTGSPALSDSFTVLSEDGTPQVVTITITGTNDVAVITGTSSGAVVEAGGVGNGTPGTPTATGDLQASDVDDAADAFQPVAAGASTTNSYGTYGVTAAGVWTYTLDNTNAAVQALNATSAALSDSFTVLSEDGTPQVVTVTINGSNDAAVITGTSSGAVVEAGGVANGTPGTPTATGDLLATDVDNGADAFQAVAAGAATSNGYGSYGVTAAGVWTYTLDNSNATVQALNVGSPALSDSFTVLSEDGTPRVVTITITGSNDVPVVALVDVTGAVTEQGTPSGILTDTGTISFTDVDVNDSHSVSAVTPSGGALGTLTANVSTDTTGSGTDGVVTWNYSVAASAVEYLAAGQTQVETFTFDVLDGQGGSVSRTVSVTITGTNDAPNIALVTSDSAAATRAETNAGLTATGTLTVTDVDLSDTVSSAVTTIVASGTTGGLGLSNAQLLGLLNVTPTSGLAANTGDTHNLTWTFNSATQPQAFDYLAPGQALTLTYTVQSADSNTASDTQAVTITINGTNDGPAAVTDNVITNVSSGTNFVIPEWALLTNDVDPDGGGALDLSSVGGGNGITVVSVTGGVGSNGFVTVNDPTPAGGSFTYQATDGTTTGASGTVNVSQDIAGNLDGTTGNDILVSAQGGATMVGNAGNDILLGGGGNDTYRFGLNDGTDLIRDTGSGGDRVEIVTAGPGDTTVLSTLNFERVGTDLVINAGSTQITVDDHYVAGSQVESIQFSPGGTVYGYALSNGAYDLSTDASNPLNEGGGPDVIASSSGLEILSGGTGNDLLFGNGGADTIIGEAGADLLVGGAGNDSLEGSGDADVLVGGAGDDAFYFSSGDSSLTIGGSGNSGTISGFDTVRDYAVITAGAAADRIEAVFINPEVVANTTGTNGADSSLTVGGQTIKSHSISNGLITFDDLNTFANALVIDSTEDLAAIVQYLQLQDLGNAGASVAFTATIGGTAHSYLFTQGTDAGANASDVLVDLFGVTAAGVTETASPATNGYLFIQ